MSIVNFISSWLKDIVVLFILISIASLIMPKGNMKKYIDLVIGLLIIFTIINPFTKLIKMDFDLSESVFNYSKAGEYSNMSNEDFSTHQEKQIESVYKDKIKSELIQLIEGGSKYKVVDISIDLIKDIEKYGQIDFLNIIIADEEINKDDIYIKKVEPIDINIERKEKSIDDKNQYKDLKKIIEDKYTIPKDKINIINYENRKGGEQ